MRLADEKPRRTAALPAGVVAVLAVALAGIVIWLDRLPELPLIFAVAGAAVGFICALAINIVEYAEGRGEPEGWWMLLVLPMLFLFVMYVLGLVILLFYNLLVHGTFALIP